MENTQTGRAHTGVQLEVKPLMLSATTRNRHGYVTSNSSMGSVSSSISHGDAAYPNAFAVVSACFERMPVTCSVQYSWNTRRR